MSVFFMPHQILEPQKCWEDWIRLGSLTKVRNEYEEAGLVSRRTGSAPNESAIQKSAYVYALGNLNVAKERFEFECRERGIVPTEEMWKKKLYRIAWLLYYQRPGRMSEFVSEHGLEAYARTDH